MADLSNDRINVLVKRKALFNKIFFAMFAVTFIAVIAAAALAWTAKSNWTPYLALLCVCCAMIVALAVFSVLSWLLISSKLKYELCARIAQIFYEAESILLGATDVEFTAEFSDEAMMLRRKSFETELKLDPTAPPSSDQMFAAKGAAVFNMSPLKPLPSLYSSAGSLICEFMEGYYAANAEKEGIVKVSVDDRTENEPNHIEILDGGKPARPSRNYFTAKGLIR